MRTELRRLFLLFVAFWFLGWGIGYPMQLSLLVMVTYLLLHFVQLSRFLAWVDDADNINTPAANGIWKELYSRLAKQRKQNNKSIKKSQSYLNRMSQLAQVVDEGVLVLKRDLRLDWWNEAAARQLNLQPRDRGQVLSNLVRDPEFLNYVNQDEFDGSVELQSPHGTRGWMKLRAAHFGQGEVALVVTEITQMKNMDRLRKEFVANVSHELRTPITVLRGYLETLSDGVIIDDPMIRRACLQMSDQVKRMQSLADDLIILSRLEDESTAFNFEKVGLFDLVSTIVDEAKVLSKGKHDFFFDCSKDAFLMARQGDVHSAVSNLVLNAVRHNPDGASIKVHVLENKEVLCITVNDDGVGISAEAIPKLTERFYRTDSSRNSKVGGSGLGLAIVKHSLNRYGGQLDITSVPGKGAKFECRFPKNS